ncbi:hypothetical protein [Reichenbachiella sp. MSK19-1]|uniref:hypothetical protein n=1 Tax=Reichenbachiella sp. MSK19-1 TaxID=1897631 RepID=UPI000E6D2D75|nr:hypothetical protein [Reichenbachiella sp. MSK19-1]RJE72988.1 hypothetical protein BGP76_03315 [Reichenbachiella sp. MSK19-1]
MRRLIIAKTLLALAFAVTTLNTFGQELPTWAQHRFSNINNIFEVSDQLKPQTIAADFDGDGTTDIAVFVNNKKRNKVGIMILLNNELEQYFVAGAGNSFGAGGDDFSWAGIWLKYEKPEAYETTFKLSGDIEGEKTIQLINSAISIREIEGSGGLIYFNGTKFVWIHQGG